jgi:hypothetical protein
MKHPEVAKLMAELYFAAPQARSALIQIGFPAHLIPEFTNARSFWQEIVMQLELGLGVTDGIVALVAETANMYPGNEEIAALHAKLSGKEPEVITPNRRIGADGPCPTLILIGADLPDEFLEVIRQQLGSNTADLLYVSKQQCAVEIPDPGDKAGQLQQQIQEIMQTFVAGGKVRVIYEKPSFRPYLYSSLTVFGPDTTPYRLDSVPSTLTPADIAAAIVDATRAMADGHGGTVSTVVDAENDNGRERLDPEKTLHENKVKDAGRLRVGTKAVAGSISPELRMKAQLRMRAQIRRYEMSHSDFRIVEYDNDDLPNRLTFEFEGPGLAPPENLRDFLAGTENLSPEDQRALPWEQLNPIRIEVHRFTIHLMAMFPVVAPYVVWQSPVFHPNIWRLAQPGIRPGTVCLGPLMMDSGYRPDLDFGYLCQLLVDIGTYRNYDVVDASTFPDPPAAFWARTDSGQRVIQSLGGPPMRPSTKREADSRVTPLWLSPLAERLAGDGR